MKNTLEYKEALAKITSKADLVGTENTTINQVSGRILAKDYFYDLSLPPFNKSSMDGFACRKEDLQNELTIIETIYAGKQPTKDIGKNECSKIMTGAVVPKGANMVFMFEQAEENNNKVICTNLKSNINICYKGEDVEKGDLALPASTLISPKHIPILAAAGIANPEVYKLPRVSVFATGTELVEPEIKPAPHQIRNSNSWQMLAQFAQLGISANYKGIIADNVDETKEKIANAMTDSDIIILSGGVSTGDYDFIPETIEKLGFDIFLRESAVQPGRPILFAKKGNKYCFGLAGNPVSSFIQFNIYVKPFLYALMNYEYKAVITSAILTQDYKRKNTSRLKLIPAFLNQHNHATPVDYNGSGHIHALVDANCLIEIPLGIGEINKGDEVNVRPF